LANVPPGTLEEHCRAMEVDVRDTDAVGTNGKAVGRGLYGARAVPGPTGVYLFGNFTLKKSPHGQNRECIVFAAERLEDVKMVISQKCPGFFINHYSGIAGKPNVQFREIQDMNDLTTEDAHRLIEVHALRPLKKDEQWLVDYGSEYRFDGDEVGDSEDEVASPKRPARSSQSGGRCKEKMSYEAFQLAAKRKGMSLEQAWQSDLQATLTPAEIQQAEEAAAAMESSSEAELSAEDDAQPQLAPVDRRSSSSSSESGGGPSGQATSKEGGSGGTVNLLKRKAAIGGKGSAMSRKKPKTKAVGDDGKGTSSSKKARSKAGGGDREGAAPEKGAGNKVVGGAGKGASSEEGAKSKPAEQEPAPGDDQEE
jgi:hypothetical protein